MHCYACLDRQMKTVARIYIKTFYSLIYAHGNVLKHTYCDMPLIYMLINQSELT